MMRLVDLNPVFLSAGGEGITDSKTGEPVPKTEGVGVAFDCPCGNHDEEHRCYVPFSNPIGPGPLVAQHGWHRQGTSFDDLTLTPSIFRNGYGSCGWHGHVTKGEISP